MVRPRDFALVLADDIAPLIFAWFSGFLISSKTFLATPSFARFAISPMIVSSSRPQAGGYLSYPLRRRRKLPTARRLDNVHRMGRMRGIVEEPAGLRYLPDFISGDEEHQLLQRLADLGYVEVRMHGQVARRVVRHYGMNYAFESATVSAGEAIPDWLQPVRTKAADLLGRKPSDLAEALVTCYPPGAAIGWHRDAPAFGDVVGVSLGSACAMRFQLGRQEQRRVFEQRLEPRSAYALTGPVRTRWQHSIPAVPERRYSLTFRTLRARWAN